MNRAKLYYLRGRVGKRARIREIRQDRSKVAACARRLRRSPCRRSRSPSRPEETDEPVAEADVETQAEAEAETPAEVGAEK